MKKSLFLLLALILSPILNADESTAKSIVSNMRMVDLAIFKFEQSFQEACSQHQNKEFCKSSVPKLDGKEFEKIYISGINDVYSESELTPIINFFNSENGKLYNEVVYQQTISGQQWTPSMPVITKEKFSQINQFRSTREWQLFESKMQTVAQTTEGRVQSYIYSKSAEALDTMAKKSNK